MAFSESADGMPENRIENHRSASRASDLSAVALAKAEASVWWTVILFTKTLLGFSL
jgi:hypothetical protein